MAKEETKKKTSPKKTTSVKGKSTTTKKTTTKKVVKSEPKKIITLEEPKRENHRVGRPPKKDKYPAYIANVFYILLIVSLLIDVILSIESKDPCYATTAPCKFGWAYNITHSKFFIPFIWVENVATISFGLLFIFKSVSERRDWSFLIGVLGIVSTVIVWMTIFAKWNLPFVI